MNDESWQLETSTIAALPTWLACAIDVVVMMRDEVIVIGRGGGEGGGRNNGGSCLIVESSFLSPSSYRSNFDVTS